MLALPSKSSMFPGAPADATQNSKGGSQASKSSHHGGKKKHKSKKSMAQGNPFIDAMYRMVNVFGNTQAQKPSDKSGAGSTRKSSRRHHDKSKSGKHHKRASSRDKKSGSRHRRRSSKDSKDSKHDGQPPSSTSSHHTKSATTAIKVDRDAVRANIVTTAQQRFQAMGLTTEDLKELRKYMPAVYPWNAKYYSLLPQDVFGRQASVLPLMIVMARDIDHVQSALQFAQKFHLPVGTRSGNLLHLPPSHNFLCNGLVIDQSKRKDVVIDLKRQQVIVAPGNLLTDLTSTLAAQGLMLPVSTTPLLAMLHQTRTYVAELALAGGLGILMRKFGLACDSLLEVELMLADGRTVSAKNNDNFELLNACRGAGNGNFGLVTALRFQCRPMMPVTYFALTYPFDCFAAALDMWQRWAPFVEDDLTSFFTVHGNRGNVVISGFYAGKDKHLTKLLKRFFSIGPAPPKIDTRTAPYDQMIVAMCSSPSSVVSSSSSSSPSLTSDAASSTSSAVAPVQGGWMPFCKLKNNFVQEMLSKSAIERLEHHMARGTGNNVVQLAAMGGAINSLDGDETAFPHRGGTFMWACLAAFWSDPAQESAQCKWLTHLHDDMQKHWPNAAYAYVQDLELKDYLAQFYGSNLQNLVHIKSQFDPNNVFASAQSVPVKFPLRPYGKD